jgi:two-component system, chemotaxis family, protein-glutamate methylesterase/glutaminase
MKKIRVLIIDGSALIRKLLSEIINGQRDMAAVGAASSPLVARKMIRELNPDVLTLDVEMTRMDGLNFLEKIMRLWPMPVVIFSSTNQHCSAVMLHALELGAVDYVEKPIIDIAAGLKQCGEEITGKIRFASGISFKRPFPNAVPQRASSKGMLSAVAHRVVSTEKLIIVGASTGGTEALKELLVQLPHDCPGILITQHMPKLFTKSFADRLNKCCRIVVAEAQGGERVLPGHAFIAPGHAHLMLKRNGTNYFTELNHDGLVSRYRPSVDVLFRSAASCAGRNAIGVILTGMGKDGAAGMLEMHRAGAYNLAQDKASCVVYGMPKEAVSVGAVDEIVPLQKMAEKVLFQVGYRYKPSLFS